MSSNPETPESLFSKDEPVDDFVFKIGDREFSIPKQGSVIRRFEQGGGGLDYLLHATTEGTLVFMPGPEESKETFDRLVGDGFAVEYLPEPDDEALRTIIELGLVDMTFPEAASA